MMKFQSLLVVLLLTLLVSMPTRADTILGGYSEIADPSQHPRLPAVTTHVLAQLDSSPYLFASAVAASNTNNNNGKGTRISLQIVQAWSQVVAGQNFRMIVLLEQDGVPVGAFTVTVYDQFGTLLDTTWGDEMPLQEAEELWKEQHGST
jgi:hypothetical protein